MKNPARRIVEKILKTAGLFALTLSVFCSFGPVISAAEGGDSEAGKKDWTVMIYMIGSNLESNFGSASLDLLELENAGIDYSKSNVVICTGGAYRWALDVPSDQNCILDMSLEEGERIVSASEESENMGDAGTLASFVNYCHENYPAKHNMLICWDHGGGPIFGYGADEVFNGDSLLLTEMRDAMEQTPYTDGESLDIVGFDACLMGSVESMSVWSSYADYYLASEELEPGDGWDYSAFSILNQTPDPAEFGKAVVDGYETYYEKNAFLNPEVTLALADLSKIQKVNSCIDALAESISGNLGEKEYAALQRNRQKARGFGTATAEKKDAKDGYAYDLVDLEDLAEQLSGLWTEECAALKEAVEELICVGYANFDRACGVSIYFPSSNKEQFQERYKAYKEVSSTRSYTDLLKEFSRSWEYETTRDWVLGTPVMKGNEIVLTLTEDQIENMTRAYYYVLLKSDEGYTVLTARNAVEPEEDNALHIPADPDIICFGDEENYIIGYQMKQIESEYRARKYSPFRFSIVDNLFAYQEYGISLIRNLEISYPHVEMDEVTGRTKVLSIESDQQNSGGQAGKSVFIPEQAEAIYYVCEYYMPVDDENGRVLPFQEWKGLWYNTIANIGVDRELRSFSKKVSEIGDAYVLIQIEDANGERYASDLIGTKKNHDFRIVEQNTNQGTLTFQVYKDHAVLVGYEGEDLGLVLPESVEGVPLTKIGSGVFGSREIFSGNTEYLLRKIEIPDSVESIGSGAFLNCYYLREIDLPESLRKIGESAFAFCNQLSELRVPEGVTEIGKGAFAYCGNLKKIELPASLKNLGEGITFSCPALEKISIPENRYYFTEDGALYTGDGKELVCFPAGQKEEETLIVREGTKRIAYGACVGAEGLKVSFPDSLEEVGNYAFYNCKGLDVIRWPAVLKSVGERGFGASTYLFGEDETDFDPVLIRIGPETSYLGKGAFDVFRVKEFEVSEENPIYTVRDGNLMNKAADAVSQFATDLEREVNIPEGTVSLSWDELSFAESYYGGLLSIDPVRIRVPDSVIRFPDQEWGGYANLTFVCSKGSEAEKYAEKQGIPIEGRETAAYTVQRKEEDDSICWYHLYEDHAELTGLVSSEKNFQVPEQVEGLTVTAIGDGSNSVEVYPEITAEERRNVGFPETIEIPGTVKTIQKNAFSYCDSLKKAVFHEGLQTIGEWAFASIPFESELRFPDSLRSIGRCAFAVSYYGDEKPHMEIPVSIGKNTSEIGYHAFGGLPVSKLSVSSENRYFAEEKGFLTDKKGRELYYCPYGLEGKTEIPKGINSIEPGAFDKICRVTDLYVPDSVRFISTVAFDMSEENYPVIHASAGSAAIDYAKDYHMPYEIE